MASKPESAVVNVAGLVQGILLVTFPSTIVAEKSEYGLSNTQYGTLFLPQVVMALTASLLGGPSDGSRLGKRCDAGVLDAEREEYGPDSQVPGDLAQAEMMTDAG